MITFPTYTQSDVCPRCRAKPEELDRIGDPRTKYHRDHIIEVFDPGILWDTYGIVADVVVRSIFSLSFFFLAVRSLGPHQPFTDDFPRADIAQLLAPDLLHQVIKGTFKDHLVEWIWEYLKLRHGEAHAKCIMDDIDRRLVNHNSLFSSKPTHAIPELLLRHYFLTFDDSQTAEDSSNGPAMTQKL